MRMKDLSNGVNINGSSLPIVRGTELRVCLSLSTGVDKCTSILDRPIKFAGYHLLVILLSKKAPSLHELWHVHRLIVGPTRSLDAKSRLSQCHPRGICVGVGVSALCVVSAIDMYSVPLAVVVFPIAILAVLEDVFILIFVRIVTLAPLSFSLDAVCVT